MYELLRYAGGKLGNRVPDMMKEKFMNFDDLAELGMEPDAKGLFNGLSALHNLLKNETSALKKQGEVLVDALSNEYSPLRRAHEILGRAIELYERIARVTTEDDDGKRTAAVAPQTSRAGGRQRRTSLIDGVSLLRASVGALAQLRPASRKTSVVSRKLSVVSRRYSVEQPSNHEHGRIRGFMLKLQQDLIHELEQITEIDLATRHELQVTDLELLDAALAKLLEELQKYAAADVVEEHVISLIGLRVRGETLALRTPDVCSRTARWLSFGLLALL